MSFLDRFKPQPRWKHADPAIRAAAVAEIPDDDEHRTVIAELARDEDARVRRAALGRLNTAADLVPFARTEADDALRGEISERLVSIATAAGESDGEAAQALEGLDDPRHFATVAKSSPFETVRTAALARVHDTKILSTIARQAADGQTALEAVGRIADSAELINIAIKTDHKDAGVAALERAAESEAAGGNLRETLETVATRARNKAVGRRARSMIQTMDEAEVARRAALEQWQQRVAGVMARVEALAAAPSAPDASIQLGDAETEWRELAAASTFEMDQDTVSRFGALVADARAAIEGYEREQAEKRAAEQRAAALLTARTTICERVDALQSEEISVLVEQARAEWAGLLDEGELDPALGARFDEVCRRATERHENRQEHARIAARIDELSHEADRVASQEDSTEFAWTSVAGEWRTLTERVQAVEPEAAQRFADAEARIRQRADERRAQHERTVRQQVQRIDQLIDRTHKRAAAEDLTLREADRIVRDLRKAVEAPLSGVDEREQHVLTERVKAGLSAIGPRLHELREMDEWKRFANAAVQEELIARTEALRAKYPFDNPEALKDEDLAKAAQELHEIQEQWKTVAEAPRAQAQALWHRYRQAADPIQVKVREFFAHRAEERKENLEKKLALIERAEALADSTDWIRTAEELKKLQAEWQQIGPVPRQDTKAMWKRFRDACDRFFTRRNTDLAQRKETWSANLAKKEALCVRAEELASSTEWDKAAAEIRRLQAEWKNVGPVRRNKSEVIWQRFRTACDTFFDRYKRRDQIELETKQADREALVAELESLAPVEGAEAPAPSPQGQELLDLVRSLRTRWNQTTPVVRQGADPLSARFVNALERLIASSPDAFRGTELDVDANRQKMDKLCARVEGFAAEAGATPPEGSSQALAAMLREALAANTIGGRAGEESKWRGMAEEVRQAQSAWTRLSPVPGDAGRELTERFHRACNKFFEQYRRRVPQQQTQRGGRPVGAR
jgi:hypothetical protein